MQPNPTILHVHDHARWRRTYSWQVLALNLLNNSYKLGASLHALHVLRQRRRRQEPPGSAGIGISTVAPISGGDDKNHPVEPLLLRWFTCVLGVMLADHTAEPLAQNNDVTQ